MSATPGSDRVTISVTDGIADVRMVRADKRNALDGAMFSALAAAGERLKTEPGVRVVVLSGEGSSFCAGLDFGLGGAGDMHGGAGVSEGAADALPDAGGAAGDDDGPVGEELGCPAHRTNCST